ncbi:uncharacterized protein LOC129594032 [Paramacrobiotus metropolitanus]|uniref:uncharacterized protein LOC129594032 n=1 Tax=Paramacrobiotus metropolitanus TaxID=2943436 RepID=UPI00244579E2|nr:uncharacterized protein LOC129594032 [Paramacrobiotus metropolitanus]
MALISAVDARYLLMFLLNIPKSRCTYPAPSYPSQYSQYGGAPPPSNSGFPSYYYSFNAPQWEYRSLPDPALSYANQNYPPPLALYTGASNQAYSAASTALNAQRPGYTVPASTAVLPPPPGPYYPLSPAAASRYLLPGPPLPEPPAYPAGPPPYPVPEADYAYPRASPGSGDMVGAASGTSGWASTPSNAGSTDILFDTMAAEPNPEQASMGELFSRLHWKAPTASVPSRPGRKRPSAWLSDALTTTEEPIAASPDPETTTTEASVDAVTTEETSNTSVPTSGIPIIELPTLATQLTKFETALRNSSVPRSLVQKLHTFRVAFTARPQLSPTNVRNLSGILDAILLVGGLPPSLSQATNNLKSGLDAYSSFSKTSAVDPLWQSLLQSALNMNLAEMPPASMSFAMALVQSILARIVDCRSNPGQCDFVGSGATAAAVVAGRRRAGSGVAPGKIKVWGLRKSAEALDSAVTPEEGVTAAEQPQPVVVRKNDAVVSTAGAAGTATGGQNGRNVVIVM